MPTPDEEMAAVLQAFRDVLAKGNTIPTMLPSDEKNRETFQALLTDMAALSSFSDSLAKGDLSPDFRQRGRMAGNFKALQANMRHMTWQAQEIAKGDFTQRLSFLGDFSTAFNIMVEGLEKARSEREQHERVLAEKNQELTSEIEVRRYAEDALRRAGLYNRSLIEASIDPLVTIAEDGSIMDTNAATEHITGRNRTTMIGNDFSDYFTEPEKAREGYRKAFSEGSVRDYPLEIRNKDGTITPVLYNATVYRDESGKIKGVFAAARDITEQKRLQNEIKSSLGEKEMLLKEIHHRVKNNMQVISGLLLVQSQTVKDDHVKALFAEAMTRIKSIALVHEQLYRSDNLSQIEYGGYLRKMFGPLFESYKADARKIAMVIEADNVMVTIEKAVPCSLIVNEMMSNSLKYAFPGDRKGEIRIRFSLDEKQENYILNYSDNGIGLPEGFVPGKTGSLGTTLINGLTRQLKGTLVMVPEAQGVHYAITFPARDLKGK
ncbi:MAG TPA: histidine kinase dimerization/phosphoacceptor domain -containing protein [Methanoregula sp.]|nr:histidine kinase dimerization/phosphoacceptor domain -containing protein [Methanoregula sp.]